MARTVKHEYDCLWLGKEAAPEHHCLPLGRKLDNQINPGGVNRPVTPEDCPINLYSDGSCRVCIESTPGQIERRLICRR